VAGVAAHDLARRIQPTGCWRDLRVGRPRSVGTPLGPITNTRHSTWPVAGGRVQSSEIRRSTERAVEASALAPSRSHFSPVLTHLHKTDPATSPRRHPHCLDQCPPRTANPTRPPRQPSLDPPPPRRCRTRRRASETWERATGLRSGRLGLASTNQLTPTSSSGTAPSKSDAAT